MEDIKQHPAWKGIYIQMPEAKNNSPLLEFSVVYKKYIVEIKNYIEKNPQEQPFVLFKKSEYPAWKKK